MSKKHEISLPVAVDMTTRYQSNRPEGFPISEAFEIDAVQKLLRTKDASYLRVYYGMKEDASLHAILVAADASGNDLLPSASVTTSNEEGEDDEPVILEDGIRCPPLCPGGSPLNP